MRSYYFFFLAFSPLINAATLAPANKRPKKYETYESGNQIKFQADRARKSIAIPIFFVSIIIKG